jgi:integrase
MATVKFRLVGKNDTSNIYIRILNGRKLDIQAKTDLFINSKDWQIKNNLPKQSTSSNKILTTNLLLLKANILERFNTANSKGIETNKEWLKHNVEVFFERISDDKIESGTLYWINHIIENSHKIKNAKGTKGLSYNRLKAYKGLVVNFTEFQKHRNLKIKNLSKREFQKYYDWLIDVKKYADSTATKKATDLQAVVRYAKSKDVAIASDFENVQFDKVATYDDDMDVITLSLLDVEKLEKLELTNEALINARKWLILACFTGQRGTALTTRIVKENFINTSDGLKISLTQIKGNKKISIPVLPKTKEILESGLPYKISTQKLNKHIKTICKEAEVDEMILGNKVNPTTKRNVKKLRPKYEYIGTHTGRRTFATLHYNKIPTSVIMKVTGHSRESNLITYINQSTDEHLDVFNDYYKLLEERKQAKENPTMLVVKNASSQN